jgi:predicted membrane protein
MVLDSICPPALIYILFSLTQIIIDSSKGNYNVAFVKLWVAIVITILLNYLCESGLGVISWFIVFIPFILMTLVISIILLVFGLDPLTGKRLSMNSSNISVIDHKKKEVVKPIDPRAESARTNTTHVSSKKNHKKDKIYENEYYDNVNDDLVNTIVKVN